jgi:hypothetical protein
MRRRASILTLWLIFSLGAAPALAAVPTPASGTTWDPNQQVQFRWKDGAVPPGWMKTAINAAASDSNRSRRAKAAVLSYKDGATSWVGYTGDMPSTYAIGYAVRNPPKSFTVRLRPQGYKLDWGTLRWCQFYSDPANGCYDAEHVALHEFGHVQTLGHVDEAKVEWLDTVMHEAPHSKAKVGWDMHAFGRCDVARLQIRYEALTTSTPYSTCLSLPTSLAMGASSTSPSYGASVTFTATLRIASDAQYAKLAGDHLAARAVNLQRRPIGGTWSNYAQMTPYSDGTGRYSLSVKISATYEWRARFSKPSNEGLQAASSPAVTVRVGGCTGTCPLNVAEEGQFSDDDVFKHDSADDTNSADKGPTEDSHLPGGAAE